MKSSEQMGGPPEQPKKEPMKDKEETTKGQEAEKVYQIFFNRGDFGSAMNVAEAVYGKDSEEWTRAHEAFKATWEMTPKEGTSEESTPPEFYSQAEWKKIKRGGAAFAIKKGREIGVPPEELERFAEEVIARETQKQDYGFVYRFRKNMGIGTKAEVRAAGEQAYRFYLEDGDHRSAISIAEDIYGRESEEWRRAHGANEAARKKTEQRRERKEREIEDEETELNAVVFPDTTFADLFNFIDAIEEKEGLGEVHFEEELWNNFDPEIVKEVLAFRDVQASSAAATKVLNFFKERGYSQKEVVAFLPIKFKKGRGKKPL